MSNDPKINDKCPLCGETAERGSLFWAGNGWFTGPPEWMNMFALNMGERVGRRYGMGDILEGVRCRKCKRLILEL
jgi:hypothetical protein